MHVDQNSAYVIVNDMLQSGAAPVHVAARRGNLLALEALVSHDPSNAELQDDTENKASPSHHAAEENRADVIEYLTSGCRGEHLRSLFAQECSYFDLCMSSISRFVLCLQ